MTDRLDEYRRRRDFARTGEPAPGAVVAGTGTGPRFVVQRHDARALHFDLRLEHEGVLRSWAVPKGIPLRRGERRLAVRTEDHPIEYLTFAGTIPEGEYGAGRMSIWDSGALEPLLIGDDEVKVRLFGGVVSGEYHLVRTSDRDWLIFRGGESTEGAEDPTVRFRALRPMLATVVDAPFDDPDWSFEIKWDGWRALMLVTSDTCEVRSRTGRDISSTFAGSGDVRRAVDCQEIVLDGELCVLDASGRAVFQDLQAGRGPVTFVAFDVLYVDGEWLVDRTYDERRAVLARCVVSGVPGRVLRPDEVRRDGRALFDAVAASGGEGIVAKRRSSRYAPGARSADWRKIKIRHELDAVICGFLPGEGGRRETFGALVLGEPTGDGRLRYVGRVGSGFTDSAAADLRRRLDRLADAVCPLETEPRDLPGVRWVRPALGCRVAFSERSIDGILRAPVFLGLESHEPPDRPAPVLDLAMPELRVRDDGREIRLTNLGKVFWPRETITKGDVLDHYARCATALVPHLAGRPMVMKRYPNGVDQPFFFQHELPATAPEWLGRVTVHASDGDVTYGMVDDALSLLWFANLGCIDLNPWHARAEQIDLADYVLFDLDPQDGVPFDAVAEVALLVADALRERGLRAHPKTSGSRGMHVLVPIVPAPHETVRLFAQLIAHSLQHARPELVTVEMAKVRRGARVYVDTNQNGYGRTIASVYSIRPVPGATVSTPVTWDEVAAGLDPTLFTIGAVAARLAEFGDLFADVLRRDQDLAAVIGAM